jgi:hypothetical protein
LNIFKQKLKRRTDLTGQRFPYPLRCETWELKIHHIPLMVLKNPFHDDILLGEMGQIEGIRLQG